MHAEFANLIQRVRAGDPAAARELVRDYEPAVRVAVRARLFDPDMRRLFDSMDICQSVLASFFMRVALGQYELHHPAQLVALLTKMAHNKLAWHVRSNLRQRRDVRRNKALPADDPRLRSNTQDPAKQLQEKELLELTWQQMDEELRGITRRRLDGQSWSEIAAAMGGTAGSRRMQFKRGVNIIAQTLGIDDELEIEAG